VEVAAYLRRRSVWPKKVVEGVLEKRGEGSSRLGEEGDEGR